ncbi:MAG TPA: TraR/DksA C4-type zinc finger protein [Patescibacteria group bacterium]|nr:TraR/DksA C4-type zinc finger protein [Patescibacteria group bacterium]
MTKTSTNKSSVVSAGFVEKMKTLLTEEKQRLERELSSFATLNRNPAAEDFTSKFPKYGDEEGDNAQEVADYEANLSIEQGLEKLLRDVKSALERAASGSYGICKYCKKPIEEKRLLARPTSSACVECKKTIVQEV